MMLRKGSVLVEVMIAITIGTLIFGILFDSLTQSNGIFSRVTATSSIERTVATIQQQFESDFSGMIAPAVSIPPDEETSGDEKDAKPEQKTEPKQDKKDDKSAKDKKKELEPFKSFIFETGDKGTIKILSFVTVNPLLTYKQTSPRAVRVAYRVIPDPEYEGKLLLTRQQSEQIDLGRFERATTRGVVGTGDMPIRTFELAHNIESIQCTFYVEKKLLPDPKDKKAGKSPDDKAAGKEADKKGGDKDQKKEENKREYMLIDDWLKLSEEERKKYVPQPLPSFGSIKITILDERGNQQAFEFTFAPLCGYAPVPLLGPTDLPTLAEAQQKAGMEEYQNRTYIPFKGPEGAAQEGQKAEQGSSAQQAGKPQFQIPPWLKGAQKGGGG